MAGRPQLSPYPTIPSKKAKIKDVPGLQNHEGETPDVSAPVFTRKLRKAAVGTGCDIRLRVSVSGHSKPSMTWFHNEEPIPPSEAKDSGGLWIRDCHTDDAGLYTCVASNKLGEASCSAVLAVMDLGEGKHFLLLNNR
uniref:Ig-like domain-containing protein n=1 Tax=Fundulus heteroclitus TaxID=8078 RepID=A0A3Q2PPQ8_FUNHE